MRRRLFPFMLAMLCLALSGCLEAEKYTDVTYDARTDTFRMLRVYYNLNGNLDSERDYLVALWRSREHIVPVIPVDFFGEYAILRTAGEGPRMILLGQPATKSSASKDFPLDPDKLVNKPGKFFYTPDKTLAYYHQIEIPGAQIDKLFASIADPVGREIVSQIDAEKARRTDGGEVAGWDRIKEELLVLAVGKTPDGGPDGPNDVLRKGVFPFNALSEESLKLLAAVADAREFTIKRRGTTLSLAVPASAADRKAILDIFTSVQALYAKSPDLSAQKDLFFVSKTLAVTKLVADEKAGTLVVSLDLADLRKSWKTIPGLFKLDTPADKSKAGSYAETLGRLNAAQIEVDDTLKLADIPAMFEKGTLPVDLPQKSTPAGADLFTPDPHGSNLPQVPDNVRSR